MGLPNVFNWVTEKVRRHSPDVATSVGNACRSSYGLGRAAVFKINNGSEKFKEYIPNSEARQKIGVFAINFVDSPLGKGALKLIPGGLLAYETYKWSNLFKMMTKTKDKQAGNHKVEADAHMKKHEKRVLHGQAWKPGSPKAVDRSASVTAKKPEDVLRDFIQNGRAFLDALFAPHVGTKKNHKKKTH